MRSTPMPTTGARRAWCAVALVAASAFAGCHARNADDAQEIPSVTVAVARVQTLTDSITAAGVLVPATSGDMTVVAPEASRIAEMPKQEGDAVKAGDVLVRFDVTAISEDIATAQANVAQATLRVDATKNALDQAQSMFDRGLVARVALDAAKGAASEAQSKLIQTQGAFHAAKVAEDRLAYTARFDGVVFKRWHTVDDFVTPRPDDPIIRVIDPTHLQVAVTLSIAELGRVNPGQMATVTQPDGTFVPARVVVRPPGSAPDAKTAEVRLSLGTPTTLPIGTELEVRIALDERQNAIVIPRGAVLRDEDSSYVLLAGTDHHAHRRDVRVGLQTPSLTQIVSGLAAGDQVITSGLDQLQDGSVIR